jgi:copper transport protein
VKSNAETLCCRSIVRLATLILIGWLVLLPAPTAQAHARLAASSVSPGAILPSVPAVISLSFTEVIDPAFSSASLIAPDQTVASAVTVARDPEDELVAHFSITDAASIPAGSWALLWRVVSAVDGHTTSGVLAFSAGTGSAPEIASSSTPGSGNWSGTIGRWLELGGLMAIAGAGFLRLIAGDPAHRLIWIVRASGAIALTGMIITLFNLIGSAAGRGFGAWPGSDQVERVLLSSSPGQALLARFGLLMIAILATVTGRTRFRAALMTFVAFLALGSFSLVGHAAGLRGTSAVIADALHIASGALWGGGLLLVAWSIWTLTDHPASQAISSLVTRYSRIAFVAFIAVSASGIASAWFNVAGPRNLTGEMYGRVLILKSILVVVILATAGMNRILVVPALRQAGHRDPAAAAQTLRRSALVELGLAVLVILLAARLASIPPADAPLTVEVAARSGLITVNQTSGDLAFSVSGERANRPDGIVRIEITDAISGAPVVDLARVIVDARTPDPANVSADPIQDRFDATPDAAAPGTYTFPRSRLGLEGIWTIDVIARRLGLNDETISLVADLQNTAPQPPRLIQEAWQLPRFPWSGYLALAAAVATVAGSLLLIRRLKGLEPVTAGIMLSVAALITIGFLLSAWRSGPVPIDTHGIALAEGFNNPAAIQRASTLWASQCASCHGIDGSGTGEPPADGGHAHPSVAGDLLGPQSQARTPEELLWIIGNGIGGTTMPAFNRALNEEERSDLVAYLLMLQANSPSD